MRPEQAPLYGTAEAAADAGLADCDDPCKKALSMILRLARKGRFQ